MNLIFFSIKTKGVHNFARRLRTVFTRFGLTEAQTQRALQAIIDTLQSYNAAPTFFIPAVVLRRHADLIAGIARRGAEIGVHGYVHNDYRTLTEPEQYNQTRKAVSVFERLQVPFQGFRNPYLGWNDASLRVFTELDFCYESNQAILHDVIDTEMLSPLIRSGFEKSLDLFQATSCSAYALRPHFEGKLLRIPTSIPDDEMLFDRLRITDAGEVGRIWGQVMQRVYDLGGLYTLNLHPERGLLCQQALNSLLGYACSRPLPVWVARIGDIAQWWKERSKFRLTVTPQGADSWHVEATCTTRATLLGRHLTVKEQPVTPWLGDDALIESRSFTVQSPQYPCIGISIRTPEAVVNFLNEQGYPSMRCASEESQNYAYYLDMPEGLETTKKDQVQRLSALIDEIEALEAPLLHFGCWPDGSRAALAVSGDIDSVTVQDFFLRVIEVS
ncbi:MAG TPA: polysaccharide deacetylase family protein [Ktedonobacteraceae bacterium]|nr:polysaccharide deacetylase family protein [Ktedonobacteraceae bacterium]